MEWENIEIDYMVGIWDEVYKIWKWSIWNLKMKECRGWLGCN